MALTKILSWNINGLRSFKKSIKELLEDLSADVVCLQETKITRDELQENLAIIEGYYSFFSYSRGRRGYSGVATYCKKNVAPFSAQEGLTGVLNGCGELEGISSDEEEKISSFWDEKELKEIDSEGRCIVTQHQVKINGKEETLTIFNVYCPRVDPEKPERAEFKLTFYTLLRNKATAIRRTGSHVVIVGDVNACLKKIDHCDPEEEDFETRSDRIFLNDFILSSINNEQNTKSAISETTNDDDILQINSKTEPENSQKLIIDSVNLEHSEKIELNEHEKLKENYQSNTSFQVVDTFRYFYPEKEEAFTCWNTRVNARATNYGTRIDYVLCNMEFLQYLNDAFIHSDIYGSDHCPVSISLKNIEIIPSKDIAPICTIFYPEFRGVQQKLTSYFNGSCREIELKKRTILNEDNESEKVNNNSTKRKITEQGSRKSNTKVKQSTLQSFFTKCPSQPTQNETSQSSSSNILPKVNPKTTILESKSSWNFLMTPRTFPVCLGHKERSVLRTVTKVGSNKGRQYYACARGVGKDGDIMGRCNFFKWLSDAK